MAGTFQIPGMPIKFSEFPDDLELTAPTMGQHNAQVLREWLGMSDEAIAELRDANVLQHSDY